MKQFFEGFPATAHPMAMLSAMVASLSAYYPETTSDDLDLNIVRLLAKVPTIAAFSYKKTSASRSSTRRTTSPTARTSCT